MKSGSTVRSIYVYEAIVTGWRQLENKIMI